AVAPAEVTASAPSRHKRSSSYDLSDSMTRRKPAQQPAASPPMASAPPPPAARAVAPSPVVAAPASAQQSQTRGGYYGSSLPAPKAAAPQQQTEDLHARADELVRANRCDDAVKVYAELDRRAQRMSPKERANYVRCLTATGRQQAAEQQLDELKADKSVTNGLVRQAETDVQSGRRVGEKAKAAKKSDADRAKPTQQQPYDAVPAAAAPTKR
ncbi:MAG TPA: hypothetical protein VIA18_15380, partial [Polyangia bacterium]|nr:hypothetical protein [Polyangia bacterium]